ncbi:6131_t:CDS:2, partial [Paraglomus occultum]
MTLFFENFTEIGGVTEAPSSTVIQGFELSHEIGAGAQVASEVYLTSRLRAALALILLGRRWLPPRTNQNHYLNTSLVDDDEDDKTSKISTKSNVMDNTHPGEMPFCAEIVADKKRKRENDDLAWIEENCLSLLFDEAKEEIFIESIEKNSLAEEEKLPLFNTPSKHALSIGGNFLKIFNQKFPKPVESS